MQRGAKMLAARARARRLQEQLRRQGQQLRLPRELPDGPAARPFGRIVAHATAHFVSRQIFTGAGKVGTEAHGLTAADVPFQLTQRADFFEEEVGLETTLKRPIINTRDEPHADPQKYRRLHVIVGDANLSEVATFLKVGTTAFVLTMVEDDFLPRDFVLASPVQAMRQVSYDLTLGQPLRLADGTTVTALDMQWELYERARKYADERGTDNVGGAGGARRARPLGVRARRRSRTIR